MKAMTTMLLQRVLPLLAALALVAAVPAQAAGLLDAPMSFSATRTVTVNGKAYTGPMFHVPGRERHEQNLLGMDEVFLLDDHDGQGFLVVPPLKTMVAFPFPPLLAALLDPALGKAALGDEKIDGVPTTKYRVDKTTQDGSHGEGFVWISKRGVLMKLAGTVTAPGGHRTVIDMALSGVKEAPQNAALFAPPQGFATLPAQALVPLIGESLQ